ncbi:hypothetical protein ABZ446_21075 [Streptomyces sp. NPDC005813]|uniref:hypothetical protein n=1 Tax=Streptomyces sp. NPDC005813 TaxID=3155592 RepID=UPI0033E73A2E
MVARGADLVVADFTVRDAVRRMAAELNGGEPLDAVIHNVGVWSGPAVLPVNVIAPYLLAASMPTPCRLVYLSSSSHFIGRPVLEGVDWMGRSPGSYAHSKLFGTAEARLRPGTPNNAVDPGWVATKMGGPGAPDDLELGHQTRGWLAVSDTPEAMATGRLLVPPAAAAAPPGGARRGVPGLPPARAGRGDWRRAQRMSGVPRSGMVTG